MTTPTLFWRATAGRAAAAAVLLVLFGTPAAADANPIAEAVAQRPDGKLRFSFAARPGVWGDGHSVMFLRSGEELNLESSRYRLYEPGPVRVTLTLREGELVRVRREVGGGWRSVPRGTHDLGMVPPDTAAEFLMSLALSSEGHLAEEALSAAVLADGVDTTPELRRLVRDRDRPREVRKSAIFWFARADADDVTHELVSLVRARGEAGEIREHAVFALSQRPEDEAVPELLRIAREREITRRVREKSVFWLGQAAGESVTRDLDAFVQDDDEDLDIRKQAVFALSQRPDRESVPALMRIARTNRHPELREKAIFWLSQKDDPRVLDFFEEILLQQ